MKTIATLATCALLIGCAQTMTIDSSEFGEQKANLTIEAPDLAGYTAIPLISSKVVNVSLSKFAGCQSGSNLASKQPTIGKATLTPSSVQQSVAIPAGMEIAVRAESQENAAGNLFTCGMAARFLSTTNAKYVLRVKPHRTFGRASCEMEVLVEADDKELPETSANYAFRENQGFWKGDDLNLCKSANSASANSASAGDRGIEKGPN